jgi:hypothetical protein
MSSQPSSDLDVYFRMYTPMEILVFANQAEMDSQITVNHELKLYHLRVSKHWRILAEGMVAQTSSIQIAASGIA